jgi:deoxycytidine triphosphate deaminase
MDSVQRLLPGEVLQLGLEIEEACKQIEATIPPYGPRQLAACVRRLTHWLVKYFNLSVGEGAQDKGADSALSELFARCFRDIHQNWLGLLCAPEMHSFPTELILPFREMLCKLGQFDKKKISFAVINQAEFNFGIQLVTDLLGRELLKLEKSLALERPKEASEDIDNFPKNIIIFTQPGAVSRDVLLGSVLLHELAHAIDAKRRIYEQIVKKDRIKFPVGTPAETFQTTASWLKECVADLITTCIFGPCVLFAIRRLSLLVETLDEYSVDHPASRIRLALMLEQLERMGYLKAGSCAVSGHLKLWNDECVSYFDRSIENHPYDQARKGLFSAEVRQLLHEIVESNFQDIAFNSGKYQSLVGEATRSLRSGLPPIVKGEPEEIVATVFNAAWETIILNPSKPFSDVEPEESHRARVKEAFSGLSLKGIEASFARQRWERPETEAMCAAKISVDRKTTGILSEDEIRLRLNDERDGLKIVPLLDPGQISKCAIDLRLGSHFIVTKAGDVSHFKASKFGETEIHKIQEPVTKGLGYSFILHPNRLVLGVSFEYVALPSDLAALVLSRSSYGRLGLLVATAIFVHPRWKGCLTLELANYSEVPIELCCGEPVAQLVLLRAGSLDFIPPMSPRSGLYPIRPQFPMMTSSKDFSILEKFKDMLDKV